MLLTVAWNTIKDNSTVVGTVPEKYTFEPSATPEARLVVLPRRTGHESIHVACVVNVDVSADHNVVLGTLLAKTRQAQTHMDRERDAQTRKRKRRSRTLNKKTPKNLTKRISAFVTDGVPLHTFKVTFALAIQARMKDIQGDVCLVGNYLTTRMKDHTRGFTIEILRTFIRQGYHTS